jgi:hypothetical protein
VALERELANALGLFARAARARQLYSSNNQVRARMTTEVVRAFSRLFDEADEITLSVRPDAFIFEEMPVFEESNAEPSVPFIFFRDGVRRLELVRGLTDAELEVLLDATANGLSRRGLDDDVVSILWRHQLEHLKYVTVDTTVVDAEPDAGKTSDVDAQIDALIRSIYGGASDDRGMRSIHIDSSDVDARALADALGAVDEMAPGFAPPKTFIAAPAYAERFSKELAEENDGAVLDLAASAAAEELARAKDDVDIAPLSDALLAIFDSALLEGRLDLLKRIIDWVKALGEQSAKAQTFLSAAFSEARVRQLAAFDQGDPAREAEVMALFQGGGRAASPALIALLPSLTDPRQRRAYSDLALGMGTDDLDPILNHLGSEQGYVAAEALHMLAELGKLDRRGALSAASHPKPQVRLTALQIVDRLSPEVGEEVVLELLDDREPRVRMEALKLLVNFGTARVKGAIEAAVARADFEEASAPVKEAFLKTYVSILGRHAFDRLEQMIESTDRRLARRQVEEVGAAAVAAIATIPSARTVDVLKKACMSRNKRVRELARAELKKMRKDLE